MKEMGRIGVLISGRGSHLKNLIESSSRGEIQAMIAVVISNQPDAAGLRFAREAGIDALVVPHAQYPNREEYDAAVVKILQEYHVDLVCLAGFMRLLSPVFVNHFPLRIMNVHPALLPSFPGLHAQRQAIACGVKVTGCTVHFVDQNLDAGPIILQNTLEVEATDTEDSLAERLLPLEHQTYREAVRLYFEGRLKVEGRKVIIAEATK